MTNETQDPPQPPSGPETQSPKPQIPTPSPPVVTLLQEALEHQSRLGEIIPVYLRYVALTLATLGVYHFWARTQIRRLLWSRSRFLGDPLEYLGRPGELLVGFVLVLGLAILPLAYLNYVLAPQLLADGDPRDVWKLGLIETFQALLIPFLFYVGAFAARRYRLTRTAWRGIRGAQSGSPWGYGLKSLWYWFLTSITLGWFYPSQSMWLARLRIENTYFGDRRFGFSGTRRGLRGPFVRFWFGTLGLSVLLGVVSTVIAERIEPGMTAPQLSQEFGVSFVAIYGTYYAAFVLLFLIYRSHEVRQITLASRLDDLRFRYTFSTWQYLRYAVGNLLILAATLTTGWMFVQRRQFNFWKRYLVIEGKVDFADLRQSPLAGPKVGEGLAETFDIGFDVGF